MPRDKCVIREALPILMFLTMKRDEHTKGRACADGTKQRLWTDKNSVSAPTMETTAFLCTLMTDAMEERDAATADLPGHFLQSDAPEEEKIDIGSNEIDALLDAIHLRLNLVGMLFDLIMKTPAIIFDWTIFKNNNASTACGMKKHVAIPKPHSRWIVVGLYRIIYM